MDDLLPRFQAPDERARAVLDASRGVVALLLEPGGAELPIRDLADRVGLSERTFYRYFPRKEDAVRPYLAAGLAHVLAAVRADDRPLREALVAAHGAILELALAHGGERFLGVVEGTERLRAVWLQALTDAEAGFAALVGERLGLSEGDLQPRLAAAVVVAAGRIALAGLSGGDPSALFAACLDRVPALFEAPPEGAAREDA